MGFTIPNEADAGFAVQSEPDSVDIGILTAGIAGNGVVSGCAVTAQGSPDMTCAVAAGVTRNLDGTTATVAAGNVTVTAAHASLNRLDLVVVGSTGTKSVTAGTAAANPVMPAIPATSVVLAAVYVPAADTTINANQITDKRVILSLSFGIQLASIVSVSAAIAATETVVVSASLSAGAIGAGNSYRIRAAGVGATGATPGSDIFRIRIGPTTLTGTIPTTVTAPGIAAVTAQPFDFEALITVRTSGAGGTIIGECVVRSDNVVTGRYAVLNSLSTTVAAVAVDTTVANLLELTYISGNAGSSNTFHVAEIEALSSGAAGASADLLPWNYEVVPFNGAAAPTNTGFVAASDTASLLAGLMVSSGTQNDVIGWDFVLAAGTWRVDIIHAKGTDRGIYSVQFDAVEKGTIDGYNGSLSRNQTGAVTAIAVAATAKIRVTLKMATKNGSSSSYYGAIQLVQLTRTA